MKRDMDLVRDILAYFEERDAVSQKQAASIQIENRDAREIQYHVDLMYEAGLLSCEPNMSNTSGRLVQALPFRLTWQGHEFLDLARKQALWEKAKGRAGGFGFEVLREVLVRLATESAGLVT